MGQHTLPRTLAVGGGTLQQLPDILASLQCRRALLVTDAVMVRLGHAERIRHLLQASGMECEVFADTVPEPTAASIEAGVAMARQGSFDTVIALGGGSPIDSAKAIAVMGRHGGKIRDYSFPRLVDAPGLPIIAIPTTAGTGSEMTRFTIITDEANDEKLLCIGTAFVPVAAVVDYELTLTLPARTTADTGIDAMTHAIEAYVSRKASPFSDSQALAAMRLIGPNLKTVYLDGGNRAAREAMMLGATLAGMAFSASSVALVHGMSRPIGAFFHVPHGLSNAMLLPAVTAYSLPAAPGRYADCARALGFADAGDDDARANDRLLDALCDINATLQVPTPASHGIDRQRFLDVRQTMASQALASGSPANNPRVPSQEEIEALYASLWD